METNRGFVTLPAGWRSYSRPVNDGERKPEVQASPMCQPQLAAGVFGSNRLELFCKLSGIPSEPDNRDTCSP